MTKRRNCGRCHTCGLPLLPVLDGEEWCLFCQAYRRYRSHGWAAGTAEFSPCFASEAEGHACELRVIAAAAPGTMTGKLAGLREAHCE